MRDWRTFQRLLENRLNGQEIADKAWEEFRDRVAILITDLSGFTRLTREIGIESVMALIYGMRRIAVPVLKRHGGFPVKYQADDLFATFADPSRALRCALALQEALGNPRRSLPAPVRLCMGIGFGEVLWWGRSDLYGVEVNLASKLGEDTAGAGEILLTAAAAQEVGRLEPSARFAPSGPISVGGKPYGYFSYLGGLVRG